MKTQSEIERLADETLMSIVSLQHVEANDFLFTRIEAQMLKDGYQQNFAAIKFLARLSAALVLFITLNAVSIYFLSDKVSKPTITVKQTGTAAEALAAEYNLTTNQYSY